MNQSTERPRCRAVIIKYRIHPMLSDDWTWDGRYGCLPDGVKTHLSAGMRKQMCRMVIEGYWPGVTLR